MTIDCSDLVLPESDRQKLILWAAVSAERLNPIYQAAALGDTRLLEALAGARAFSRGELSVGPVRKLAFGCHAAARDVQGVAATAATRVCGQAVAVAHMAGHSREIARYTAKALGVDSDAAAAELAWQRKHVPTRFRTYVYGTC